MPNLSNVITSISVAAKDANNNFTANVITANLFSGSGASLTSLNGSNVSSGTIANARTTANSANGASTIVARDAAGSFAGNIITATTFSGSGASLTSIPNSATTAASANGASTIVARDANGDFTANVITANLFSGSGASLSSINASSITTGTLASPDITENVQVIGTNTNAVRSRIYILTASLTLTLPSSPSVGDTVSFRNRSGTTTAIIARNGSNIMSLAEDMTLDSVHATGTLVYVDATRGWTLV